MSVTRQGAPVVPAANPATRPPSARRGAATPRRGEPATGRASSIAGFVSRFAEFRAPSWAGWRGILAKLGDDVRELWCAAGRGSGKSRMSAVLAAWAASRTYRVAPGERMHVVVIAPDRRQAGITFGYISGLFAADEKLAALVESEKGGTLRLSNGVTVEVVTASKAAPRGRSIALAIIEESAFLPTDEAAEPDTEILRAVRPGLARCPGSLLVVVGSPYARRGELWKAHTRYSDAGGSEDGAIVYENASTATLNPSFDAREIDRAFREDPESAAAEYGGQFRSDVANFLTFETVDACTERDVRSRPRDPRRRYVAFVDPSGGSQDSFTLAIAHDEDGRAVIDTVREIRPPFSPEAATAELAAIVKAYGVREVTGDRYAGEWPRERFSKNGVRYTLSDRPKSDIYRDALPLFTSGAASLIDEPRLERQLLALERRTSRAGRDSIDHPPSGRDDVANAVCGALLLATGKSRRTHVVHDALTGRPVSASHFQSDYGDPWS